MDRGALDLGSMDCGPWSSVAGTVDRGLWTVGCGPWTVDCWQHGLQTVEHGQGLDSSAPWVEFLGAKSLGPPGGPLGLWGLLHLSVEFATHGECQRRKRKGESQSKVDQAEIRVGK